MTPTVHPRVNARRRAVALAKAADNLLARLDHQIDCLSKLSRLTGQFADATALFQTLRDRAAVVDWSSAAGASLAQALKKQLGDITVAMSDFNPESVVLSVGPERVKPITAATTKH